MAWINTSGALQGTCSVLQNRPQKISVISGPVDTLYQPNNKVKNAAENSLSIGYGYLSVHQIIAAVLLTSFFSAVNQHVGWVLCPFDQCQSH